MSPGPIGLREEFVWVRTPGPLGLGDFADSDNPAKIPSRPGPLQLAGKGPFKGLTWVKFYRRYGYFGAISTYRRMLTRKLHRNYLAVRKSAKAGNRGYLERLYLEHERWEKHLGKEYRKLRDGLCKKGQGYKYVTSGVSYFNRVSVLTWLVEIKTNRRVLDGVPYWEVIPKLRALSASKLWVKTPLAYLKYFLFPPNRKDSDFIKRSKDHQKFIKMLRNKWVPILKKFLQPNSFSDYLLLPKDHYKDYALGNSKALDFRVWLPIKIRSAWKYNDPPTALAIDLNNLDKRLNSGKAWVKREDKSTSFLIFSRVRDFHKKRAGRKTRSLMAEGNWAHPF
jgi:hypothetical protein